MHCLGEIVINCNANKRTAPLFAIMLIHSVDVGRELCSKHERISALYAYFPSFILNTYTVFVAIFS